MKKFVCKFFYRFLYLHWHLQLFKTVIFCDLIALILGYICVKGLRVTKIVKEIKFEVVSGKLEAKKYLQRKSFTKYLKMSLVFIWNGAVQNKFNFKLLFKSFSLAFTKFSFWQEDWILGYHSMELTYSADIS